MPRPRKQVTPDDIQLFTKQQVADLLNIHYYTVDSWIKDGRIPVVWLGERSPRIPAKALRDWIQKRTIAARQ